MITCITVLYAKYNMHHDIIISLITITYIIVLIQGRYKGQIYVYKMKSLDIF